MRPAFLVPNANGAAEAAPHYSYCLFPIAYSLFSILYSYSLLPISYFFLFVGRSTPCWKLTEVSPRGLAPNS